MNLITNHRQNHKEEIYLADRWTSLELEACVQLLNQPSHFIYCVLQLCLQHGGNAPLHPVKAYTLKVVVRCSYLSLRM